MMSFDKLWAKIAETKKLPSMTIIDMPNIMSEETKKLLVRSKRSAEELANCINCVIDTINNGSIERVDVLLQRKLNEK